MNTLKDAWRPPVILLIVILVAGAVVRFHFAATNSYWLDELYSVTVYGTAHDSIVGVIRRVSRSVQLPLYPIILYNWMAVFGDSEVATRTLSNIYIVGATACLYLAVRRIYGTWLGVVVALVFTLMFTPTYYGMETRGYAQSIFLSSLSTLLLTYALPRLVDKSWRDLVWERWLWALSATNAALLMTHYFNVLFLAAQGVFMIIYLLYRRAKPGDAIAKSVAIGGIPVALLLLTWGPFMVLFYLRHGRRYVVESVPKAPWETLSELIIYPNFGSSYAYYAVLVLVAWVAVVTLSKLVRRPDDDALFTLWFLLAAIAPAFLAFVLFFVSEHERYSSRYFSLSVGPLAVVVVLGLYQVLTLMGRVGPVLSRIALVLAAIIAATLVAPSGLYALQKSKVDWRGIARQIVDRVERQPDKTFFIYETTFKKFPTLNYYLSRYSHDIRVGKTLQRFYERGEKPIVFSPPDADYAVVAFTHQKVSDFPRTLAILNGRMKLLERHLDESGRGYLVFSVPYGGDVNRSPVLNGSQAKSISNGPR